MATYGMNELFGYGPGLNPPAPFPMYGEEIVDPRYHEAHQNLDYGYGPYNYGRVQYEPRQFYYGDRDPRGYHNGNDRADYTSNRIPFQIPDREEYHSHPITVPIRLSNPRSVNLDNLRFAFDRYGLDGNVLTVTGYPGSRRNGANEFVETVRSLTGDRYARLA